MQKMNKIKILTFLFICHAVLAGCINDDLDDCIPPKQELTVQFLHNINPLYENILPDVLDHIDLYIYNDSGRLARYEVLPKARLDTTGYAYRTTIETGTYTLVALMNTAGGYACEGTGTLDAATMRVVCDGNRQISDNTQPVYYGYDDKLYDNKDKGKQTVIELDRFPVQKTINFANNTSHIRTEVRFSKHLAPGSDVEVYITGRNGVTDFTNACPGHHPSYTYFPYGKETVSELTYQSYISDITTQRLWDGDDLELTIVKKETGRADEVLASVPLTPLIMKNPLYNNDYQLERYYDYELLFDFIYRDYTWVLGQVTVNDWETIQQPTDL